nr:unnamed protein product [Digitaria exilis]
MAERFQSGMAWGQAEGCSGEARGKPTAAGVTEEESTAEAAADAEKESAAKAAAVAEEHDGDDEDAESRVAMATGFSVRLV